MHARQAIGMQEGKKQKKKICTINKHKDIFIWCLFNLSYPSKFFECFLILIQQYMLIVCVYAYN